MAKNYEIGSNDARDASVDMKLEVVVIPVSDVDHAKEFYGRLGWRLDADFANGDDFRVIQFTPPGSGCWIIFGKNVTAAEPGSAQGLYLIVSDIGRPRRAARSRHRDRRSLPRRRRRERGTDEPYLFGAPGQRSGSEHRATARSPRSVIRTVTAGCSRKSRLDCPADRFRDNDLCVGDRSGECTSPCGGCPRRAREAHRAARHELARLVRHVHGERESGEEPPKCKTRLDESQEDLW